MLDGYRAVRPLAPEEAEALPILARGAALRFMLTRLVDWLNVPPGRPGEAQGSARISRQAAVPPHGRHRRNLRAPMTDTITIWTDGACSGNPGPGGWGAIVRFAGADRELKGGAADTTNNRMELMAAITALKSLDEPSDVDLYTDSQYVRGGITGWMAGWKRNGWRTADKKPVKNMELWQELDEATARHKVRWHWVKGHAGHPENERADLLARQGMAPFLRR